MKAEVILTAGFASTKHQVERTSKRLSEYLDKDVEGINYTDALAKNRAFFDGRDFIITHSGGINALDRPGIRADQIIAIAPPVPQSMTELIVRGFHKLRQCEGQFEAGFRQSSAYEGCRHLARSVKQIHELSRVSCFTLAQRLASNGSDITIAMMSDDGLFDYHTPHAEDDWFDIGGRVHVKEIAGDHLRFTNEPIAVMRDIALASTLMVPRFVDSRPADSLLRLAS